MSLFVFINKKFKCYVWSKHHFRMDRVLIGKDFWDGYLGHDRAKKMANSWPRCVLSNDPKINSEGHISAPGASKGRRIRKKATFHGQNTFFCSFTLPMFCTTTTWNFHVLWRKCRTSSCSLPKFSRKKESPLLLLRTRSPKTTEKLI